MISQFVVGYTLKRLSARLTAVKAAACSQAHNSPIL